MSVLTFSHYIILVWLIESGLTNTVNPITNVIVDDSTSSTSISLSKDASIIPNETFDNSTNETFNTLLSLNFANDVNTSITGIIENPFINKIDINENNSANTVSISDRNTNSNSTGKELSTEESIQYLWKNFKQTFNVSYADSNEESTHYENFHTNVMFYFEQNRNYALGNESWIAGINQFSDLSNEESNILNGHNDDDSFTK